MDFGVALFYGGVFIAVVAVVTGIEGVWNVWREHVYYCRNKLAGGL